MAWILLFSIFAIMFFVLTQVALLIAVFAIPNKPENTKIKSEIKKSLLIFCLIILVLVIIDFILVYVFGARIAFM